MRYPVITLIQRLALTLSLLALPAAVVLAATDPAHPNIVLILIDDMGYGDIGPFGSTLNRTPNLDQMAKDGMKLTSFYDAPECSVSRAQIMTGCYGQRVTIVGVLPPASRIGLNASEHTVAELLKDQGYATMCVGKWHLGDAPDYLPTHRGFDHYFGLPYSNDMNDRSKVTGQAVVPLMRDDQVAELVTNPQQHFLTKRYTEEAVKFIQANQDHPFFLYFAHTAVHTPISPGPDFQGKSKNGRFGDWVEEVDWSVGQVLDTLRQLKLDSNTLVMFTSDNGPWLAQGTDAGTAAPLRGGKFTTWEGGVREPTLAWWPGHVPAGVVTDTIGKNIDFLPTFVSLAGGTVPASPKIDGQDISPLLLGKTTTLPNDVYYYYRLHELDAVREGPWKLALRAQLEGDRWEKGSHLPPDANTDAPRLYNLDTDIGERTNVAAQHPDIVAHLTDLFNAMIADLGTDGKPGPGVRPPGKIEHPVMLYPAFMKPRPGSG